MKKKPRRSTSKPASTLTGRARKDQLMPRALELAGKGAMTFKHVCEMLGGMDGGVMKLWADATDVSRIERAIAQARAARPKVR